MSQDAKLLPIVKAKLDKAKGLSVLIDGPLSFCMWVAVATLTAIFIATVAKTAGIYPKWMIIPTAEYLQLLYAAGVVYLLRH